MSDWWYPGQLARQDWYTDAPPARADWPAPPQMQPDSPAPDYDVFERAAQRVRQAVKPEAGRQEYPGQIIAPVVNALVTQPLNKAQGMLQTMRDYSASEFPGTYGVIGQTTDYDPRGTAADYAAGTALNTLGTALPFAQPGAVGAAGGKLVQPAMGELADQAAPPFYSAAQRAVENAKLGKGTPEQWLGYLRNQPGVKGEEVDRMFGNLPAEGMLTKADMQAHAAENAVTLGEVNKGAGQELNVKDFYESHMKSDDMAWSQLPQHDRAYWAERAAAASGTGKSKYSQWQLPGGENYREKLLTLPSRVGLPEEIGAAREAHNLAQRKLTDALDEWKGVSELNGPGHPGNAAAYERVVEARTEARAAAEQVNNLSREYTDKQFKSSHWDEPNVLAHMRMNDREVPGVGKSLHLEEIQSDWHQKGRTQGYQKQVGPDDVRLKRVEGNPPEGADPSNYPGYWESFDQDGNMISRHRGNATEAEARAEAVRANNNRGSRIPNAPFKTTWPDVALKRSIRDAAEGGYDALSWTPGEAQAARYDLSAHLKELQYFKNPDSTYSIGGTRINGEGFNHTESLTADQLPGVVGKEMAEKIINNEGKRLRGHPSNMGTFEGVDLKIGGEGMKAFYDKMLVDKANALGKKHGARVEQAEIDTKPERGPVPEGSHDFSRKAPVHVLRITPQLREAAMKGFPLFSAGGGAVMGGLAAQDNYE